MNLSNKEKDLVLFIRKFKFGKVELVIHASEPQKIIIKEQVKFFGEGLTDILEERKIE